MTNSALPASQRSRLWAHERPSCADLDSATVIDQYGAIGEPARPTAARHGTDLMYRSGCRGRDCTEAARKVGSPQRVVTEQPWTELANCRGCDPALFFPGQGESTRDAKAVCAACEVRRECLDYALRSGEKFGIWGGKSERERRRIRRQAS